MPLIGELNLADCWEQGCVLVVGEGPCLDGKSTWQCHFIFHVEVLFLINCAGREEHMSLVYPESQIGF